MKNSFQPEAESCSLRFLNKVIDPNELLGWHGFVSTAAGSADCANQPGTEQ